MSQKTLIAVIGPTAIGKTALAIRLANYFNTDIISADSRQFYKEMSIGTAVPSLKELHAANHHFIQHKSIHEHYSVGNFESEALTKLNSLFMHRNVVILVGGSGLYVDAVVNGLDEFPVIPEGIRKSLVEQLQTEGLESLQELLGQKDPTYHKEVDLENPHRVIRALEVCMASGQPYSSFLNKKKKKRPFKTIYLGISAEREIIYGRINQRVDKMIQDGLVKEARSLLPFKNLNALQTVGYKELFTYFEDKLTLGEAIEEIKKNTRRFAKRQMTWYRKNNTVLWVDFDSDFNKIIKELKQKLSHEN